MGSDLPLRLLLFKPMTDFASFLNDGQVGTLTYRAELVCVFGKLSTPERVVRRCCAAQHPRGGRFKYRSWRIVSRLTLR
jgi:hypothetical protein